MAYFCDHVNEP